MRHPTPEPPAEVGVHDGLAYTLWLPAQEPLGGIVIIHGAGSAKESHHDFARAARGAGFAALAYDQRGHGSSAGALDGRLVDDVASAASLLPRGPLALRGSSLGGYVALVAAAAVGASAVIAICPASAEGLLRGLRRDAFGFPVDAPALERFVEAHDARRAVAELEVPLMLLHAEGDERVPAEHSRELHRAAVRSPRRRLVVVPGGHHRSVQHDDELQGEALRFLARALAGGPRSRAG